MYMNAIILDAQVGDFHDGVDVNLYDIDEKETYKGKIVEGLAGLEEMRKLKKMQNEKKQSVSDEELGEAAALVEMPPLVQPIPVFVRRVNVNKGFMKLLCRLEHAQ